MVRPNSSLMRFTSAFNARETRGAGSASCTAPATWASSQRRTSALITRVPGPVVRSAGAW